MLDTLVKAAEKVGQLLDVREKRRKEQYEVFIEPVYTTLLAVHTDYVRMFEICHERLDANEPFPSLIYSFSQDQRALEPVRRDLAAKIRVFGGSAAGQPYADFFHTAEKYLVTPELQYMPNVLGRDTWDDLLGMSRSRMFKHMLIATWKRIDRDRLTALGTPVEESNEERIFLDGAREEQARATLQYALSRLVSDLQDRWNFLARAHAEAQVYAKG